jgi:hypothetical protein
MNSPPSLRILHYAHTNTTRTITAEIEAPPQKLAGKEKPIRRSENVPPGLSRAEVEHLDHCVSCGAPWIIKRTASQKLFHIEKCAKKRDLSLQTIRSLLSKVKHTPGVKDDAREQGTIPTRSLLDHLLGEKKPAAKRRRDGVENVSVLDTEQAQTILRNKVQTIYTVAESSDENSLPPPATQAFTTSKLAQRFRTTKSVTEQGRLIANEVPSTQTVDRTVGKTLDQSADRSSQDVRYQD